MTDREYSMVFLCVFSHGNLFMVILRKGMIMERRKIEIGERLRREREKAGYSQEAFTEILDCCAVTISRCW